MKAVDSLLEIRSLIVGASCSINVVDGEVLFITKVSRLHMAVYLCIASNGVPPSISKRVQLKVQCEFIKYTGTLGTKRQYI
ncbi:hypothetical protein NQ315_016873 [Exocentrus adspersus]|uniref:Uncharacterized protein n=1 Tax=Exocentrus adspersus TaxID=1586481 RepID=A0AAV8VZC9_9CUCU|nr:hypothetical protein NQ315_016873 [Exocentrus adspersus]